MPMTWTFVIADVRNEAADKRCRFREDLEPIRYSLLARAGGLEFRWLGLAVDERLVFRDGWMNAGA